MILPRTLNTPGSLSEELNSSLPSNSISTSAPTSTTAASSSSTSSPPPADQTEVPLAKVSTATIVVPVVMLLLLFTLVGAIFFYMRRHPGTWRKRTPEERKGIEGDDGNTESVRGTPRVGDDVKEARLAANAWIGGPSRI
jgi:hypothetical protein